MAIEKPGSGGIVSPQDPALLGRPFFQVQISHIPTRQEVSFDGWVDSFSDNYSSQWNTETVYGRMDPLATYQGTQRSISLEFAVVSKNGAQAASNLSKINQLIEFLYPVYDKSGRSNQNTLKAAPLWGLRWTNLIGRALDGKKLIGFCDGISYAPDLSYGGFLGATEGAQEIIPDSEELMDSLNVGGKEFKVQKIKKKSMQTEIFIPKQLSISFGFTPLHTHLMGWHGGKFGGDGIDGRFPNNHGETFEAIQEYQQIFNEEGQLLIEQATGKPAPITQANESEVLEG